MTRTILVADDSLAVHRAVEKALSERGDEIRQAASGDEALALFEGERLDAALVDVHMPGVSGYEVASRIKSSAPELPVLLLVGTFEPYDEELAARSRADGSLMKPFDGARLVERLDELTGYEPSPTEDAVEPPSEPPVEPPSEAAVSPDRAEAAPEESHHEPEEAVAAESGEAARAGSSPADAAGEASDAVPSGATLSDSDVERIARRVVERLSGDVVERVAREILPEIAEAAVRRRIEELEREEE